MTAGFLFANSACGDAAPSGFHGFDNPGGGHILVGTVGHGSSIEAATAAVLRAVHQQFGSKPTILQSAVDASAHQSAVFFTEGRGNASITGLVLVEAPPGGDASGAVLYDTTTRFASTVRPMLAQLKNKTEVAPAGGGDLTGYSPVEPLVRRDFPDGTGSIDVPADWKIAAAGGGGVTAFGPSGEIVWYNQSMPAMDPANPRGQMFLRMSTPQRRQIALQHTPLVPYTADPARAWTAVTAAHGGTRFTIAHVTRIANVGSNPVDLIDGEAHFANGQDAGPFMAYCNTLTPDPMGQWNLKSSLILLAPSQVKRYAKTAYAVLSSVRINQQAVAAQDASIRKVFQQKFDAMIASQKEQNAAREQRTQQFLANDAAAQEGMHRQAVAMENFSLDRTVVVDTVTGRHGTVGNGLADALVHSNPRYQPVPASQLLRGVDY